MNLQDSYNNENDIPEAARGLYEQDANGAWKASFSMGGGNNDKIKEFRENNIELKKQLEQTQGALSQLQEQFSGITPEHIKALNDLQANARKEEEQQMIASGRVDELMELRISEATRTEAMKRKAVEEQLTALQAEKAQFETQMAASQAMSEISSLLNQQGVRVRPEAAEDLRSRVASDWSLDNGKLTPTDAFRTDSGEKMTVEQYVNSELLGQRGYLFVGAKGSAAAGNQTGGFQNPADKPPVGDPEALGRWYNERRKRNR